MKNSISSLIKVFLLVVFLYSKAWGMVIPQQTILELQTECMTLLTQLNRLKQMFEGIVEEPSTMDAFDNLDHVSRTLSGMQAWGLGIASEMPISYYGLQLALVKSFTPRQTVFIPYFPKLFFLFKNNLLPLHRQITSFLAKLICLLILHGKDDNQWLEECTNVAGFTERGREGFGLILHGYSIDKPSTLTHINQSIQLVELLKAKIDLQLCRSQRQ